LEPPHFGQLRVSATPQFAQNLRPSRLSLLHFEQRISPRTSGQFDEGDL